MDWISTKTPPPNNTHVIMKVTRKSEMTIKAVYIGDRFLGEDGRNLSHLMYWKHDAP